MSLHLIESTKVPTQSSRKRFGATASVILHATLVVGAFTAASAAPVVNEKRVETEIVYVAPEAPKVPARAAANSASLAPHATTSEPRLALPVMPDLLTIPVEIPPIVPDRSYMTELLLTRDAGHTTSFTGTGVGTETGTGSGTVPGDGAMSELQVDRQVTILSGYRTPRYPEALRVAGVEETLNASFVVDTLGRVESGSLEIPDAKHAPFVAAVHEALANARFRPAELRGRRVRQRVVQAFVFSLQRQ